MISDSVSSPEQSISKKKQDEVNRKKESTKYKTYSLEIVQITAKEYAMQAAVTYSS